MNGRRIAHDRMKKVHEEEGAYKDLSMKEALSENMGKKKKKSGGKKHKKNNENMAKAACGVDEIDEEENAAWAEVWGRAMFGTVLIEDTTGKLDKMCPDDFEKGVGFGEEVLKISRVMHDLEAEDELLGFERRKMAKKEGSEKREKDEDAWETDDGSE